MQAVISSEFIIEPAFADEINLAKSVDDLIKINKIVNNDYQIDIIRQDDLLDTLIGAELYPSEGVFRKNIAKYDLEDEISSQDIVTMIHSIIQRSQELSSYSDIFDLEYDSVNVTPGKNTIFSRFCVDSLIYDLMMTSVINNSNNTNLNFITGNNNDVTEYNLQSDEVVIYSQDQTEIIKLNHNITLTKCVDDFLLGIGATNIWNNVSNNYTLALAIYTRVLELRVSSGKDFCDEFTLDCFIIGDSFYDSILEYQCGPDNRFGSSCFEAISRLIFESPKYALNPFRIKRGKAEKQRKRGNDLAFRTHVTKGGEAILAKFNAGARIECYSKN